MTQERMGRSYFILPLPASNRDALRGLLEPGAPYRGMSGRFVLVRHAGVTPFPGAPPPTRTKEEAAARAAEAIQRLERGDDFADVASALSDEPHADRTGGDLGPALAS